MTEPKYGSGTGYPGTPSSTGNTNSGTLGTSPATNASTGRSDPPRSPEQLREDIARTRSAISQDMAALGEKLNPEHLKENAKEVLTHAKDSAREGAKDLVRDAKEAAVDSLRHAKDQAIESISESVHELGQRARVAGHGVQDFVATHAVPLSLAGVGLGWLLISLSHQRKLQQPGYVQTRRGQLERERSSMDTMRERTGDVSQRAAHALHDGRDRLAEKVHDAEEKFSERAGELRSKVVRGAEHLGDEAAQWGHRAYDGLGRAGTHAIEVSGRNPLATGLLALAAGVTVGMLLPSTRRENQWLGETRDRWLHDAQRSASELKESVEHGAAELRGAIAEVQQPSH